MRRILIIESDATFAGYLARALTSAGFHASVASTGREGLAEATQAPPDLVVLTPELSDVNGLNVARRLRVDARTRGVRVFMVSARTQPHDILNGALAGADAYFSRYPGVETEIVARVVAELSPRAGPAVEAGRIVAVVGAAGGVGTSTLALNLAHVLGGQMRVLVADLAAPMGTLADRIGAEPGAAGWPDSLSGARSSVVTRPEWACDVLTGLRDPYTVAGARMERIADAVLGLQPEYDLIVSDLGRGLDGPGPHLLPRAAVVVAVLSADATQVGPARRVLDHWQARGVSAERMLLVVNRAHGADGLTLPQLERALGLMAWAEVPYGRMLAAQMTHEPLERSYPRDPAAAVIRDLAAGLAQHLGLMETTQSVSVDRAADRRRQTPDRGGQQRVVSLPGPSGRRLTAHS